MNRFHIVVFNYERIESFLKNFDKITNFRPDRDKIVISDCSVNHESQKQAAIEFAHQQGWRLGREIELVKRNNWGIDQGARIDYLTSLRRDNDAPQFIWQFQEHYLDLQSSWSIWPDDAEKNPGQLKGDTIPDHLEIDLDQCEHIYQENPKVSVLYADREKIGVLTHEDGRQWFYADGANFSVRATHALEVFRPDVLESYKAIYDGSYQWTLFMELDICRRLTVQGRQWYDLVSNHSFSSPSELYSIEKANHLLLHQVAEEFYKELYRKYELRFLDAARQKVILRKLKTLRNFCYLNLRSSKSIETLRRGLTAVGLDFVAKRALHYVAGVPKEEKSTSKQGSVGL